MPQLSPSDRALVRQELEALGYTETEIKRTFSDIANGLPDDLIGDDEGVFLPEEQPT